MTRIEWTDVTWNPVTGCTKVSPGCKHCYAETLAERFWATSYPKVPDEGFGIPGAVNQLRSREFTDVLFHEDRLESPLRWKKPRRVFVNSMSDLFHERLPDEDIDRIFAVMALTPRHTYQILTKRPARMLAYMASPPRRELIQYAGEKIKPSPPPIHWYHAPRSFPWPLPNVWLGTSVEDQDRADERIPFLLQTPAAVRWISAEPLLGPINLDSWPDRCWLHTVGSDGAATRAGLDWVVCGGESGPGARPMDPSWARSIRDQCVAAVVPYFFKQWGGQNKKEAGRMLGGRTWDEMPTAGTSE